MSDSINVCNYTSEHVTFCRHVNVAHVGVLLSTDYALNNTSTNLISILTPRM